jgi:ribosomal protein S3AE
MYEIIYFNKKSAFMEHSIARHYYKSFIYKWQVSFTHHVYVVWDDETKAQTD